MNARRKKTARTARRAANRRAGFTLIEVMVAAGIILFGAVGIMALQQAATRGNRESREMMTATTATQAWLERLQRGTVAWRQNGMTGTIGLPYLGQISGQPQSAPWFVPATPNGGDANLYPGAGRDWFGAPTTVAANIHFCTLIQLTWLNPYTTMRAEVITWWQKDARANGAVAGQIYPNCGGAGAPGAPILADIQTAGGGRLHAVYGSTVLRWNGATN